MNSMSSQNTATTYDKPHKLMIGLYLAVFLGMLSETSMNIALPSLCETFSITTGTAQWMVVGYMLAIGIVLPCVGFLLKRIKAKTLVLTALICFLIGAILSAIAPNFGLLLFGRILQGISTGVVLPTMYAAIMRVFPPQQIGAANGLAGAVVMFAPVIGPTLSGILIGVFSWRAIFVLFAIIAAIALICTAAFFVTPIETSNPKIDVLSILSSVIGFGCLVAGASLVADLGFSALVIALLVIGIVVLVYYVYRQLHIDTPLLDLKALRIAEFRVPVIMVTCSFACTLSIMYLAPQELQNGLGLDSTVAGLLMLAGGIVNAVCSFVAGRMYDSHGATMLVRIGAIVAIIGGALFLMINTGTSSAFFVLAHVVIMIGIPLMQQSVQSAALKSLPRELASDGSTIMNTFQQVFGAIATSVATCLLTLGQSNYAAAGGTDEAQGFVAGSRYGYVFALVLIVLVLLFSFILKEKRESTPES